MNAKIFFVILFLFLASGGGVFLFQDEVEQLVFRLADFEKIVQEKSREVVVQTVERPRVSLPPPLRAEQETLPASDVLLTRGGVIVWTNTKRAGVGLPQLVENAQLNRAAELKLQDMFARQYFAHVSPLGNSVDDLARQAGYEYIALGENLALGNYKDDSVLVQAWMDSQGHRENILNDGFAEIGVAVGQGMFSAPAGGWSASGREGGSASGGEGQETWLAVQEFGRPLADCSQPDEFLKAQIDDTQPEIDAIGEEIQGRREELERTKPRRGGRIWKAEQTEYNKKVEEYNALVEGYNALAQFSRKLADEYNSQVNEFNACVGG